MTIEISLIIVTGLLLITFIAILSILFYRSREEFTNQKKKKSHKDHHKSDHKLDRKSKWEKRFKELHQIPPKIYTNYFKIDPDFIPLEKGRDRIGSKQGWIMISIASYRDEQCLDTVNNMTENADNPEKLHFVICQQNTILEPDCECRKDVKITIERLKDSEARGPTWARYRIQELYEGEEYVLQIDAHTRMIKSWDSILKSQLNLCDNPNKSVLTQYPCEFDIVSKDKRGDPTSENWRQDKLRGSLFIDKFDEPDGFTRIQSLYSQTIPSRPFRSVGWAAGFSFSKAQFIVDVPYDPCTPFLFFGEEMDIAIRGFTHGYDYYSPNITVVFHNYKRNHRKTFWEKPQQKPLEILSRFRIYVRLGYLQKDLIPDRYAFILTAIDKYPLGQERTIEEYEKIANIDIFNELKF